MPRLIDANELKEWVENWLVMNAYYHPYSKSNNIPIPELYDILGRLPTVDAIEVVRCEDCKWKELCQKTLEYKGVDGYCSKGERREDAETN